MEIETSEDSFFKGCDGVAGGTRAYLLPGLFCAEIVLLAEKSRAIPATGFPFGFFN
jgi:hypothetical protein